MSAYLKHLKKEIEICKKKIEKEEETQEETERIVTKIVDMDGATKKINESRDEIRKALNGVFDENPIAMTGKVYDLLLDVFVSLPTNTL